MLAVLGLYWGHSLPICNMSGWDKLISLAFSNAHCDFHHQLTNHSFSSCCTLCQDVLSFLSEPTLQGLLQRPPLLGSLPWSHKLEGLILYSGSHPFSICILTAPLGIMSLPVLEQSESKGCFAQSESSTLAQCMTFRQCSVILLNEGTSEWVSKWVSEWMNLYVPPSTSLRVSGLERLPHCLCLSIWV